MKMNGIEKVTNRIEEAIENEETFYVTYISPEMTINEMKFSVDDIWSFEPNEICFFNEQVGFSLYISLNGMHYEKTEDWIANDISAENKVSISFFK